MVIRLRSCMNIEYTPTPPPVLPPFRYSLLQTGLTRSAPPAGSSGVRKAGAFKPASPCCLCRDAPRAPRPPSAAPRVPIAWGLGLAASRMV